MNTKLILLFGIVAIALVMSGCCCITTTTTPTVTAVVSYSATVQKDLNMSPTSTATPVGIPTTGVVTATPNRSGNVTIAPANGSPSF